MRCLLTENFIDTTDLRKHGFQTLKPRVSDAKSLGFRMRNQGFQFVI